MNTAATLEKLDAIRGRTGATYAECWQALRCAGGDEIAAIVRLESQAANEGWTARMELGSRVRQVVREAVRLRLAVRQGGRTVMEVPAVAGAVGALFFPTAAVAGVFAALATRCSLTVERSPAGV